MKRLITTALFVLSVVQTSICMADVQGTKDLRFVNSINDLIKQGDFNTAADHLKDVEMSLSSKFDDPVEVVTTLIQLHLGKDELVDYYLQILCETVICTLVDVQDALDFAQFVINESEKQPRDIARIFMDFVPYALITRRAEDSEEKEKCINFIKEHCSKILVRLLGTSSCLELFNLLSCLQCTFPHLMKHASETSAWIEKQKQTVRDYCEKDLKVKCIENFEPFVKDFKASLAKNEAKLTELPEDDDEEEALEKYKHMKLMLNNPETWYDYLQKNMLADFA